MTDINYDVFCGRRSVSTNVMLSRFERDVLQELADECEMSMSALIRDLIKERYLKWREEHGE